MIVVGQTEGQMGKQTGGGGWGQQMSGKTDKQKDRCTEQENKQMGRQTSKQTDTDTHLLLRATESTENLCPDGSSAVLHVQRL